MVERLAFAGSPIEMNTGDAVVKRMAHEFPVALYQEMVTVGGELMRGETTLGGCKDMRPVERCFTEHVDLCEHVDDPAHFRKEEIVERRSKDLIDLRDRWGLQATFQLFKESRLAKGGFVGLGRRLKLRDISCPTYLLASEADDITPKVQASESQKYLGAPKERIERKLVPGGHAVCLWDRGR